MPFSDPKTNPWYYLENFQIVLQWIKDRYLDLLVPDEQGFIEQFLKVPRPARALLVRMIMRKGELFRTTKLNYAEIGGTQDALRPLVKQAWVDPSPTLRLDDMFSLFVKAELAQLFRPQLYRAGAAAWGKPAQLEVLRHQFPEAKPLQEWLALNHTSGDQSAPHVEQIVKVNVGVLAERFRLMFFGNLHQDWTELVLADLGLFTYEAVSFPPSSRAFHTRQEVDDYLHLHHCKERFAALAEPDELGPILEAIPGSPFANAWLEERRGKLLFRIGQHCERRQDWSTATRCYLLSNYPGARARRIRVLEREGQYQPALSLARTAIALPENEAEHQSVQRMLPRLERLCGSICVRPRNRHNLTRIDLTLPDWGPTRVEEQVRRVLSEPDAPVFYVENTLVNSLFGLLCWDVIFAVVPGAFFHPFQQGPADLFRPDFHARRHRGIEERLGQLQNNDYKKTIRDTYARKQGVISPFVAWTSLSTALLDLALACIPPQHLQASFRRLLQDLRNNRTGLPDLIQFWPDRKSYRLIEVKGPGDRLQDNQLRWLDYCSQNAIPASVCYVQRENAA